MYDIRSYKRRHKRRWSGWLRKAPPFIESGDFCAHDPELRWPLGVVSWNIHLGKRYAAVDRAFSYHAGLAGAAVVALQEVGRSRRRSAPSQARGLAIKHGLNYVYAGAHRCGLGIERGQAILSPYPIERAWRISLPVIRHHRIALAADIRAGDELLRVVNVHLENRSSVSPFIRRQRGAQLAHVLASLRDEPPARTVLMGDFNTLGFIVDRGRSEILPALLAAEGYIDAHAGLDTVTHRPFRWQLDWIFSKDLPPLDAAVINTGKASDHLPLWASLGSG
jgi:endonuclease/exonuclease/phosphatase family metal-dependent hydrolase